jgi:hypothetical protein
VRIKLEPKRLTETNSWVDLKNAPKILNIIATWNVTIQVDRLKAEAARGPNHERSHKT